MKQEVFEKRYRDQWLAFDNQLDLIEKKGDATTFHQFPHAYRRLCKHLALARDRQYSVHLVNELNGMVVRAHQFLYHSPKVTIYSMLRTFTHDFPQAVRRDAKLFWVSFLLFYGPLFGLVWAIHLNPELAYSILSPEQTAQYEQMYDPSLPNERTASDDMLMFGFYIWNNVGIAFRTFASGLLFGVGSIFILLLNGVSIGAVAGHLIEQGFHDPFLRFVSGHSSFELTAIVLAGMAGMRLGFAMLAPGNLTRRQKIMETAHALLPVVYGMGVMLLIAAFIEAFWSPRDLPASVKYSVSALFWSLHAVYFLFSGREHEN